MQIGFENINIFGFFQRATPTFTLRMSRSLPECRNDVSRLLLSVSTNSTLIRYGGLSRSPQLFEGFAFHVTKQFQTSRKFLLPKYREVRCYKPDRAYDDTWLNARAMYVRKQTDIYNIAQKYHMKSREEDKKIFDGIAYYIINVFLYAYLEDRQQ